MQSNTKEDTKVYKVTCSIPNSVPSKDLDIQRNNFVTKDTTNGARYITSKTLSTQKVFDNLVAFTEMNPILDMGKQTKIQLDRKFSTGKMRIGIGKLFFQTDLLSDDRWTYIRKLAKCLLDFHKANTYKSNYTFSAKPDKTKVHNVEQFTMIWYTSVYLKLKHPAKFPRLNYQTLLKLANFVVNEFPNVYSLEIYHPLRDTEVFLDEVNVLCEWFDSPPNQNVNTTVSYRVLKMLIAKSFYGYAPSPQYIGKLGYDCPQTRTYSLSDFKQIRAAIIESNRRRGKPDNFIIIESL